MYIYIYIHNMGHSRRNPPVSMISHSKFKDQRIQPRGRDDITVNDMFSVRHHGAIGLGLDMLDLVGLDVHIIICIYI